MTLINILLMLNIIRKLIFIVKILNPLTLAFLKNFFLFFIIVLLLIGVINYDIHLLSYFLLIFFYLFLKLNFLMGMLEHYQQGKLPILMNFTIYLILFIQYLRNKTFQGKSVYPLRIKATKQLLSLP